MAQRSYEEQRQAIERDSRRQKRKVALLTCGGMLLVIAAFVTGLILKPAWVGFFAAGGLILLGFLAKIGGEALANAKKFEQHQLELLDENAPAGRFKWE